MVEKKKRGEGTTKDAAAKKPSRPKRPAQGGAARGALRDASERPRLRSTVTSKSEGASRRRTMKTTVQTRGDEPVAGKKKLLAPKRALIPRDRDGHRAPPSNGRAQGRVPAGRADGTASRRKSMPPPSSVANDRSRELALAIATAGLEKKAIGVEVLDVSGRVDYADFLVIMTGTSDRHVHAISTGIEEALRKNKQRPLSVEGLQTAMWVLIDYDDVVVHVFQEETRRVYDIEGLWMDAGRVDVDTVQA